MNEDDKWMKTAIQEAIIAQNKNEVPVGAVIVRDGHMIAKSYNQPISKNDPTSHAEIEVLRLAGEIEENYRFNGATIYVTLEPCAMCLGAMMNARISRIVFGAYDPNTGVCGSSIDLTDEKCFNHKIKISGGILERNCKELLQNFFQKRRKQISKINESY